jgi:hypothetical protein
MSWLRAARKVVDPDRVEWDIYVTRVRAQQAARRVGSMRTYFGLTRRIEAITDWPEPRTLVWEVEGAPGRLLLDEIARGIALGTVPRPVGASYLGESTR